MKKFLRTMLSMLLVISMLLGCGGICEARAEDLWDMAAPEDSANPDAEIKLLGGWWHILLLGVDSYTRGNNRQRTDSMIMLSVNLETSEAKLTSFMRDTWVKVPGTKDTYRKLTELCAVGGPELTMRCLNENFSTQLEDYALVSMESMADIIDILGGIELDVTEAERKALNKGLFDLSSRSGMEKLEQSGEGVHLNGNQAVAFARIRKIDSDYVRTERQRTVLVKLAEKIVSGASAAELLAIAQTLLEYVETNLSFADIMSLAYMGMNMDVSKIGQLRIPADGTFKSGTFDGIWCIKPNFSKNKQIMKEFVYG